MRVFLCHASEQRSVADEIAFELRNRGHRVFLDRDELEPAKTFNDPILQEILAADLFVFLISPQSLSDGRYTLTELEYARHRWRKPHGNVLPVLVRATDMARVPAFLKSVTILEPKGNVPAEVAFAIDQLRGAQYVARVVGWFTLAGLLAGLAYLGTTEGWLFPPNIPYEASVWTAVRSVLHAPAWASAFYVFLLLRSIVMPAGPLLGLVGWYVGSVSPWRASVAALVLGLGTSAAIHAGNAAYDTSIAKWREVKSVRDQVHRQSHEESSQQAGDAHTTRSRAPAPLDRALSLEWLALRAQIGAAYGVVAAVGFAGAGIMLSRALAAAHRWLITIAAGAGVGGLLYAASDSLTLSFLLFHTAMFALVGYWIARGQT